MLPKRTVNNVGKNLRLLHCLGLRPGNSLNIGRDGNASCKAWTLLWL